MMRSHSAGAALGDFSVAEGLRLSAEQPLHRSVQALAAEVCTEPCCSSHQKKASIEQIR